MQELFAELTPPEPGRRPFRVVHTADWHLGKPLGDLSREPEHARFLTFLLQTIAAEKADLLIVAGDVFDAANPPQSSLKLYYEFLAGLRARTRCRALVVAGNHDSPACLDAPKELLGSLGVDVVGSAGEPGGCPVFRYPDKGAPQLAVAAVPFLRDRDLRTGSAGQGEEQIRAALAAGIASRYADAAAAVAPLVEAGAAALATGHLTVGGSLTSDSERDIHIGGLGSVPPAVFPPVFQYVALGHLHRPQAAREDARSRYSGSPIPLSFSEADDIKELRLLDFSDGRLVAERGVAIPPSRHLVRLRCDRTEVAAAVRSFAPPQAALPTWVELTVEGEAAGDDPFATALEAAAGRGFEVVKVTAAARAELFRAAAEGARSRGEIEAEAAALDDPAALFARRLDAEPDLDPTEREGLRLAFQQLLELHGGGTRSER